MNFNFCKNLQSIKYNQLSGSLALMDYHFEKVFEEAQKRYNECNKEKPGKPFIFAYIRYMHYKDRIYLITDGYFIYILYI